MYEYVMFRREQDMVKEKMWHFYQHKPEDLQWEAFYRQQQKQQNKKKWGQYYHPHQKKYEYANDYQPSYGYQSLFSKTARCKRTLGIPEEEEPGEEEVKAAFRRQAMRYHPDR